jgi:hypothetical protein
MFCSHVLASMSFHHARLAVSITSYAAAHGGQHRPQCRSFQATDLVNTKQLAQSPPSLQWGRSCRGVLQQGPEPPRSVVVIERSGLGRRCGGVAPLSPRRAGAEASARAPVGSKASRSPRRCGAPKCHALAHAARGGSGIARGIISTSKTTRSLRRSPEPLRER